MIIVLQVLAKTIAIALSFVSYAMIGRMLIPIFVNPDESRIYYFLYSVTEPFVLPVRAIFDKLDIGRHSPFDIPFFVTYFLIFVIEIFLPAI